MTDGQPLAEGLADYIAVVRGARGASIEESRLLADLQADRIAYPKPAGMTIAGSHLARAGGEAPVRIYRPAGEGALPGIVYFHGGGFTTGSIESYEPVAMALAEASGAVVVSVHYDRLPEASPRTLIEQCYDALRRIVRMAGPLEIDAGRLAVAGDSAGACIAAMLAILARDRHGPRIACQLLCYGAYDLSGMRDAYRTTRDPILTTPVIEAMIRTWQECSVRDPAPLPMPLHCDALEGLPPALFLGAALDGLLEEGSEFARRLRDAGVPVIERVAPAMPHGFLRAVRFSAPARDEMRWLGDSFRNLIQTKD